jgi:hypothetical protein
MLSRVSFCGMASPGFLRVPQGSRTKSSKVDAIPCLDNLEAIGKTFYANILVAIVECLTVRLRKLGTADLFAPRTPKNFNPMVGSCHPANMHP